MAAGKRRAIILYHYSKCSLAQLPLVTKYVAVALCSHEVIQATYNFIYITTLCHDSYVGIM